MGQEKEVDQEGRPNSFNGTNRSWKTSVIR